MSTGALQDSARTQEPHSVSACESTRVFDSVSSAHAACSAPATPCPPSSRCATGRPIDTSSGQRHDCVLARKIDESASCISYEQHDADLVVHLQPRHSAHQPSFDIRGRDRDPCGVR